MKITTIEHQSKVWKIFLFIFYCCLPALSTPSYKLPITPVSHTNSPVRSGPLLSSPLILHRQNTILAKHQQASHHSIISQSINFVLVELAIPCKQTENVVVQTSLCKRVKVQVSNISTHCTARRLK